MIVSHFFASRIKRSSFTIVFILALLLTSNVGLVHAESFELGFSGRTMGTTYHVKVVASQKADTRKIGRAIDRVLEEINDSMSTYRSDSEISRFNRRGAGDPMKVSEDFFNVMRTADYLYRITGGAWDGTIKPLVDLWGFGAVEPRRIPDSRAIATTLKKVGFDRISLHFPDTLQKSVDAVTLDLASIAKGYGVDRVSRLLKGMGFENFIVEIGGEIFASGTHGDGALWKAGINRPQATAALTAVYQIVPLRNQALATSGDYRNFFEMDGKRYTHVIDPSTGYPVPNGVVSASVTADTCTLADGLATALMVMGPEKAVTLVDTLDNVECLIITQGGDGSLKNHPSAGWKNAPIQ